jgi:DNA-binding IclR family transcriptional regulator
MAEQEVIDDAGAGTHQNIARASEVLTVLANASAQGMRLVDVVSETSLSKTAAHRCLSGLVAHGLAEFNEEGGRYYLGDRVFGWTSSASQRFELAGRSMPYLQRLSQETGDTAYLAVRRRDEAVCYGRAEGSFPIKTLTLSVGDRRPLGIGGGSLALLAFIDDDTERERILQKHAQAYASFQTTTAAVRKLVNAARSNGHTSIDGQVIGGMAGVGVPVRTATGVTVAALSIAAISTRMQPPRRAEVVEILRAEAARFEQEMQAVLQRL